MGKFLKKKPVGKQYSPLGVPAAESRFAADYPCLYEYLTVSQWEDKSPRLTSTLLLFVDEGRWKVCFTDKDADRYVFLTGLTVEGILNALEAGLKDDQLDWRKRREPPSAQKGGKG